METNLLIAIENLVKNPIINLGSYYQSSNRVNKMGDPLEIYIKDLFCNSLGEKNLEKKKKNHEKYFSYFGTAGHPPDLMIRNGDAIEVKKVGKLGSAIALNSSHPKDKLFSNDLMLTAACRNAEAWYEKDMLYVIGTAADNKLKALWFIYGDCYAANKEVYGRIRNKISEGVNELSEVEFSKTNELGRVNKIDPLGITHLRIRGMWGIENPTKVFNYVASIEKNSEFTVHAILLKEKYLSFPEIDRKNLESLTDNNFSIKDIKIKSPDDPEELLEAKLLTFKK